MMTKVTTRTKKEFMVMAAVERGLFKDNSEASKNTNKVLYKMIKEWDAQHDQQQQDKLEEEMESKVNHNQKEEDGKKKRLPKKGSKTNNNVEQSKMKEVVQDTNVVEPIQYTEIDPFKNALLRLLRINFGVNYSSLEKSRIPKEHFLRATAFLDESINVAMAELNKTEETELFVHLVDKNGNITDKKVYINRDMIAKEQTKLEDQKQWQDELEAEVFFENSGDEKQSDLDKEAEDKETADIIIATFNALKFELDRVRKDNDDMKAKVYKLESFVENTKRREANIYNEYVNIMNKIANTKDERYVWVWKEFNKLTSMGLAREKSDSSPIMLDIQKLIIEESIKTHEKVEEQDNDISEMKKDTTYEGDHISYIHSEAVKPYGVRKRKFNLYKERVDDCEVWVDYVLEQLIDIDNQKDSKRKKLINNLKIELEDWYDEWMKTYNDNNIVDMVTDIMLDLVDSKDRNKNKTMSDLVAVVDSLDL